MSVTVGKLQAVLAADTRQFDRAMDKSHSKMQTVGKTAGIAGAAIFAGLGVVAKRGFDELKESQKVTAQTNAVLKSTGGIAHISAKGVTDLANAISLKTGIDDEAVQSGENLLLTFRGIRNETGKGNDIFSQATKTLFDMSTALGQDATKSAIQLGKALNDPIKGVGALQRVGVTFTESQKETIKQLVTTGHAMQAQKLILHELNTEFGGSAEAAGKTLPGQLAKARNAFDEMAGNLVQMLLPAMTSFASVTNTVAAYLSAHPKLAKAVTIALTGLATALVTVRLAQIAFNLSVLANPYVAATVAIVAMSAALFVLWQRSKTARTAIEIVGGVITLGLLPAIVESVRHWNSFTGAMQTAGNKAVFVGGKIVDVFQAMLRPFGKAVSAIIEAVHALGSAFDRLWSVFGKIIDGFRWIIANVKKIGGVFDFIGHAVGGATGAIGDASGAPGPLSMRAAAEGKAFHVGRQLWDEIAMGEQLGLGVTSGYRPGAVTKHGTKSDHSYLPSRAVDMSGPASGMAGLFRALIGRKEIRQAFYDPLGSIFNGVVSSYREGGHSDHIHIAEYDKGGWLPKGLSLALNTTGRPERVLPGSGGDTFNFHFPNFIGSERELESAMRRMAELFRRRNGRSAFGA